MILCSRGLWTIASESKLERTAMLFNIRMLRISSSEHLNNEDNSRKMETEWRFIFRIRTRNLEFWSAKERIRWEIVICLNTLYRDIGIKKVKDNIYLLCFLKELLLTLYRMDFVHINAVIGIDLRGERHIVWVEDGISEMKN